jgi:diguanylate cyclase (GGDEF)-like protein/PAS domain S-box-containing protein
MPPGDDWFDAVADAIIVVDDDGTIRRASASCRRILGYDPDDLIGQSVDRLVPSRFADHGAQRSRFHRAPATRVMAPGGELVALRKDGSELPVDISLSPTTIDGRRGAIAAVRDMSDQHRLSEILRLQSLALEAAANGIVITDRNGVITWSNAAFSRMTGYQRAEILGQHTRVLKSGAHEADFYRRLWETVLAGDTWSGEIVNRRRDGSRYHEEQMITPVSDRDGAITHFIAIKQDVSERKAADRALRAAHQELAARVAEIERLNRQLHEQAIRDPLTGLFNRRYLEATIEREHARLVREGKPLAVVMLDIDRFKRINDDHGHAAGDEVLKRVGELIRSDIRGSDLPCRFGGEEFLIALPGASLEAACGRAESWRQRLAATPFETATAPLRVTVSAGVAAVDGSGSDVTELIRRADDALYAAKRSGRNRVEVARRL